MSMATTARQSGKHPGGRPRTVTPAKYSAAQRKRIDEMAEAQAKDAHIAAVLGVDDETFKREFGDRCIKKRAEGKARILRAQFDKAAGGDVTMGIWFGKQHLEQADKQDHKLSGEVQLLPPLVK
jgi:hypothetical protein